MPGDEPSPERTAGDDPVSSHEAARRLEERLERASEAAERLLSEAAARDRKPPSAGWQAPAAGERHPLAGELELLTQLIRSVRDLVPPELERRLAEALHELLLALRALIDFYLERLDRRAPEPAEVEDIPIN